MSPGAVQIGALAAALARIEAKVDALTRSRSPRRLLSKRAAARVLGVDRGTTLEALIRGGHLRLVMGRVPDTEIDRLLADGIPEPVPRAKRSGTRSANEAGEIRTIRI